MQWWIRPGPRRAWAIANAWPGPPIMALAGQPHVGEGDLAVPERARRGSPSPGASARSPRRAVERHEHHRVLVVAVGLRVGEAHEDGDPAVRVPDAGAPPLAPVDHDLVALDDRRGLHVGGVGGRHVGLGHAERRADPPVEQRLEPLPLLLLAAEVPAAPPCCRCRARCSCTRAPSAASRPWPRPAARTRRWRGRRRSCSSGRKRFHRPRSRALPFSSSTSGRTTHGSARREQLAVVVVLARSDLLLLKGGQPLQVVLGARGVLEVHSVAPGSDQGEPRA